MVCTVPILSCPNPTPSQSVLFGNSHFIAAPPFAISSTSTVVQSQNPIIAIAVLLFYGVQGFVTRSAVPYSQCPANTHLAANNCIGGGAADQEEQQQNPSPGSPLAQLSPQLSNRRLSTINFVNVIKRRGVLLLLPSPVSSGNVHSLSRGMSRRRLTVLITSSK